MVDDGEAVSATVRREFEEEAGNIEDAEEKRAFQAQVAKLFEHGHQIYRGYIDDPRNTDNVWTETTAFHFHCSEQLGAQLQLRSGDGARAVKWLEVDSEGMQHESWLSLYGAHRSLIERAVRRLQGEVAPDSTCENVFKPICWRTSRHLHMTLTRRCWRVLAAGPSTAGCAPSPSLKSSPRLCRSRSVSSRFLM